jgi:hypothetical protein
MPRNVAMVGLGVLFAVVVVQIILSFIAQPDGDRVLGDAVAYADQGRRHLLVDESFDSQYNSFPPTSGPQAAVGVAPGIYGENEPAPFTDTPSFASLLPILEQGGIVIYYDAALLGSEGVDELSIVVSGIVAGGIGQLPHPNMVLTPLPGENFGGDAIYATAWRHVLAITPFDEAGEGALTRFSQFPARNPAGFYERFQFEQAPLQESLSSAE